MKNQSSAGWRRIYNFYDFRQLPVVTGIFLVYVATVFMQSSVRLTKEEVAGFTIVTVLMILLYMYSEKWFGKRYWLYLLFQGIIIFDCAVIMSDCFQIIFEGLIPIMVYQSMIYYKNSWKVAVATLYYYGIFVGTIIIYEGIAALIMAVPILVIITFAIRVYSMFYLREVNARVQSQRVLKELELAYEKVEMLTLSRERVRVAQDLHDTLSQDLAGLILQLDAADAHLEQDNGERAQTIIKNAIRQARKSMSETRLVIDDLRFQKEESLDLTVAIEESATSFENQCSTRLILKLDIPRDLTPEHKKHLLMIVKECMSNIAKHAEASKAYIRIYSLEHELKVEIEDDGKGFDIRMLDRQFGYYGMIGIHERVKAMQGELSLNSKKRQGTSIKIRLPLAKGV